MRRFNSTLYPLLSTFLLFVISCGQTDASQDDLIYYTTIAMQMKEIKPVLEGYWHEGLQNMLVARQNEDHKLDKKNIDTLKKHFADAFRALDEKIKIISSLKETDKELALKDTIISYLTDIKKLDEEAEVKTFELMETGLDKVTDEQKAGFHKFIIRGQALQNRSQEIENLSLEYQKKHNITKDELIKYGL
jgi:hypothetical protein